MITERMRMDGKTAIVAGAGGGGIGTATSLALAEAGAAVTAVDVIPERVKDTEDRITAVGGKCLGIVGDVQRKDVIQDVVKETVREFGTIDYVANIAGGSKPGQMLETLTFPDEMYDEIMNLNMRWAFLMCKEAAQVMAGNDSGGSIVNVATIGGLTSCPTQAAYGAAKAGLMSLTRTMAIEWAPKGIRVNAVAPGVVLTPRSAGAERMGGVIPIGRVCEPEEIASGMLFLLSDMGSGVTGHTLVIDGGATVKFALW